MKPFNHTLITGPRKDIDALARQIAAAMAEDETRPNPDNLREGWASDEALCALEEATLQEGHEMAFAEVCNLAAIMLERSHPTLKAQILLLKLGALNGFRRAPANQIAAESVDELIAECNRDISALDAEDTRTQRLAGFCDYQQGVWDDRVGGDYGLTADRALAAAQAASAAEDFAGAAIEQFRGHHARLSQMLVDGADYDALTAQLRLVVKAGLTLFALCGESKNTGRRRWALLNAPWHTICDLIWAAIYELFGEAQGLLEIAPIREFCNLEPEQAAANEASILVCEAFAYWRFGEDHARPAALGHLSSRLLEGTFDQITGCTEQALYTAHLLAARVAIDCEGWEEARTHLTAIVNDEHGMRQIKAVARLLLHADDLVDAVQEFANKD